MDALILGTAAIFTIIAMIFVALALVRWRRNRYRFSIRALLMTFVLFACVLYLILHFVTPILQHRWAIQRIYLAGGRIDFHKDYEKFGFEYSKHGQNPWRDVGSINAGGDREAIVVAEQLKHLPEMEQVRLFNVRDAGLASICEAKSGPSFNLLDLYESRLTGAGLSKLEKLTGVHSVFINTCAIDDDGLGYFASMPNLQHLWLIEEGALANPARFTEKGFAEIGRLKNLKKLRFNNLKITDEAARRLHDLTRLKKLHIGYCQISDEAIQNLRAVLPDCEVIQYKH